MFKEMNQINEEYNGQWVFLIECKKDINGAIIGGKVAIHNENRDKVISEMRNYIMEDSDTYFRYAGEIPNVSVIL